MKRQARVGLLFAVAMLAGCATTWVNNSWTSPTMLTDQRPKKTLVVAMFPNEAARRTLEEQLSARLNQEGVGTAPASAYLGNTTKVDRDQIQQLARSQGFDTVVVSRFVGIRREYSYSPGIALGFGVGSFYPGFGPYYGWGGSAWYGPGYYYPEEHAVVETSLLDVQQNGKVLWSATSSTLNPQGSEHEMAAIADKVVKRMDHDAVLSQR